MGDEIVTIGYAADKASQWGQPMQKVDSKNSVDSTYYTMQELLTETQVVVFGRNLMVCWSPSQTQVRNQ